MNGRYIDADDYRKKWADIFDSAYGDSCCEMFKKSIDEQPTADVVEVVRCKDCLHFTTTAQTAVRRCERWKNDNYIS